MVKEGKSLTSGLCEQTAGRLIRQHQNANRFLEYSLQKNRKSEHHHQILHIRNNPGTKFQLKMKTLNFLTILINRKIVFPI